MIDLCNKVRDSKINQAKIWVGQEIGEARHVNNASKFKPPTKLPTKKKGLGPKPKELKIRIHDEKNMKLGHHFHGLGSTFNLQTSY